MHWFIGIVVAVLTAGCAAPPPASGKVVRRYTLGKLDLVQGGGEWRSMARFSLSADGSRVMGWSTHVVDGFKGYPSGEPYVRIWEADGREVAKLGPYDSDLLSASLSPDGKTVAVVPPGEVLLVINIADGKVVARLSDVSHVRFLDNDTLEITTGSDKVDWWNRRKSQKVAKPNIGTRIRSWIVESDDERRLHSVIDPVTGRTVGKFTVFPHFWKKSRSRVLDISTDGRIGIAYSRGIQVRSTVTGELLHRFDGWDAMFCLQDTAVAVNTSKDELRVFDLKTGRLIREFDEFGSLQDRSSDGALALVVDHKRAEVWNMRTLQKVAGSPAHTQPVIAVACDRPGSVAASLDDGGSLQLWNASSGEFIRKTRLPFPARWMLLDLSADGRFAVAAGWQGVAFTSVVAIWQHGLPRPPVLISIPDTQLVALAASPDGASTPPSFISNATTRPVSSFGRPKAGSASEPNADVPTVCATRRTQSRCSSATDSAIVPPASMYGRKNFTTPRPPLGRPTENGFCSIEI